MSKTLQLLNEKSNQANALALNAKTTEEYRHCKSLLAMYDRLKKEIGRG